MKIAIASGKGGTGKTLLATNLFNVIQQSGYAVGLIDCDAEEPNDQQFIKGKLQGQQLVTQNIPAIDKDRCTFCGKCQEFCQYNAIIIVRSHQHIRVFEDLCHDCGACGYACQSGAISWQAKTTGTLTTYEYNQHSLLVEGRIAVGVYSSVPLISQAIKGAQPEQITILDAPPGTSCPFIATVNEADFVVLVTEPTPFGLNDLKLSVQALQHLNKAFGVVINRAGLGNQDVHRFLTENKLPLLEEIPFDRHIAQLYSEGELITNNISAYNKQFQELFIRIKKQIEHDRDSHT